MRRNLWIFAILAVAMIFTFAACSGGGTTDSTQGGDPTPTATPDPNRHENYVSAGTWLCTPEPLECLNNTSTPVERYGQLQVIGSQLCDQNGDPVVLHGVSSHGLHWFGEFVNKETIEWFMYDWNINIFRASMYTGEKGYLTDPSVKEKLIEAVDACLDLGLYVIIDWHILEDNNPMDNVDAAVEFFKEMATKYGDNPNVIYEIMNEPNGNDVDWLHDCKPYAERLISEIRAIDPDNIILVGNPRWSSFPREVMESPLGEPYNKNIAYVYHLYTNEGLRKTSTLEEAMNKGLCIFVSEWGAMDSDGDGELGTANGNSFIRWMKENNISWCAWSLSDKDETCAFLKNKGMFERPSYTGGWLTEDLSAWGKYLRNKIRNAND